MESTPPAVSSSSTLWATGKKAFLTMRYLIRRNYSASKNWIIPAKPKPGRKSKNDAVNSAKKVEEVGAKDPMGISVLISQTVR